jgi:ATP-dependent DNA ligase
MNPDDAEAIENDHHSWGVQPKMDGCRALLHIGIAGFRVTGRTISEVTYRLTEHQDNLRHLSVGWGSLVETILDGEIVCSKSVIDTGSSITASPLQVAIGILATTPEKAASIQAGQNAHLEFHTFDIIRYRDRDLKTQPLYERLAILGKILGQVSNPFVKLVPTGIVGKRSIHIRVLESGGEGTVWKRLDSLYCPGRRVPYWVKRKRSVRVEAFVSGSKPGNNAHAALIGAVEFSTRMPDGSSEAFAWVSGWSDQERQEMTRIDAAGKVVLNPSFVGRNP